MLNPSYLLHATEPAEEIAEKLHTDIINRIVDRILIRFERGNDYILTPLDKWQIETLQEAGFLLDDIQKTIAEATGKMQSEIAETMEDAGVRTLEYDDGIYRTAGLDPVPLVQSPYMIRMMQRDYEATLGEWRNFTNISKMAVHKLFVQACDTAYHQAMSGTISPAQAILEALETIIEGGAYVEYPGGRRDTIETATARAVRTGISQASGNITDARMEEMDWDIILVSSHLGARVTEAEDYTNHYWWQGQFYSKSGNDKRFPPYSVCGFGKIQGIHGANCRHSHGPGDGVHNPFEYYDSEENRKMYELEQRQRELERRIRKTKRETMNWKKAADSETDPVRKAQFEGKYQQKAALLQKQNKAYNEFCEETGLKKQHDRIRIAKWDRAQAAQARAAAKKWNTRPDSMAKLPKKQVDNSSADDIIKSKAINRIDLNEGRLIQQNIAAELNAVPESINLDGIPVQAQNYVLDATKKVTEKYPQLREHTKRIAYNPNLPNGVVARSASLTGTIEVGPDFLDLEDLQKTHNYGIKLKYNPKGTENLASTIVHEYGHQLDGYLTLKGVYGGSVSQYGVTRTSAAVQKEVLRRIGLTDERLREIRRQYASQGFSGENLNHAVRFERQDFIESHLSSYAYENCNEFFAEAFSEYMMSDNPRELARVFGEVLEEIMEGIT